MAKISRTHEPIYEHVLWLDSMEFQANRPLVDEEEPRLFEWETEVIDEPDLYVTIWEVGQRAIYLYTTKEVQDDR